MLIKYQPKVEHLKCVTLTQKEGLVLERTMVKLLPGTNEVTDDEWKAMRGNITAELEANEIIILAQKVSAGRGKVGGIKAKDLKQMPTNLAVKYVSECINPDTLKKWYKEITNEEVRLAITKRFEKLELEVPEDEIPDTKLENEAPMTLDEFDSDEENDSEDLEDSDSEDSDEENDSDSEDSDEENDSDSNDLNENQDSETDFENMSLAELKSACKERGIDVKNLSKKIDYINVLKAGE